MGWNKASYLKSWWSYSLSAHSILQGVWQSRYSLQTVINRYQSINDEIDILSKSVNLSAQNCCLFIGNIKSYSPIQSIVLIKGFQQRKLQLNSNTYHAMGNSADDKLIFFLFFPENRLWHIMQTVSLGDNLHEIKVCLLGKIRNILQNVIWWNFYPMLKKKVSHEKICLFLYTCVHWLAADTGCLFTFFTVWTQSLCEPRIYHLHSNEILMIFFLSFPRK